MVREQEVAQGWEASELVENIYKGDGGRESFGGHVIS